MKIRKAIFPAAGLGTRFLPATKAQPKEMLPLVDKPMIQYVVEEAIASGIEQIILVTGRGKRALEDHFDKSFELEHFLAERGKYELLEIVQDISEMVTFAYIRQKDPLGLGHAILTARDLIGNEPFAVLLGDDIIDSPEPCLKQLIDVYNRFNSSVLALQQIPRELSNKYGIIVGELVESDLYKINSLVEKPEPEDAPSDLGIVGRYILTPEIFDFIEKTPRDHRGEIQITDAINRLAQDSSVHGLCFQGKRFDTGNPLGWVEANILIALKTPELKSDLKKFLQNLNLDE
ncbi:MAG: UTP--glucose-1-phosphate uridylyltransferase [Candidatus Schekmanbacteria bacterium RBG_13_48_7]|uniref:UTP--glucose-1-phosphate uridylyltransferase n=1 Tax=Candidatus Schekmanbacteria bacterium RBG_13_48_7 TaxID=1817878 RepID=A0A1F7S7L9_9BACT|nr:MAG: UTP--glucose-1-phosphate uridylyltransferase [Candidatus Schekmanbacteria bacterium RBG_13_48_7]